MSYYFTILSPSDVPVFSLMFGTSKAGGDGIPRFRSNDMVKFMNQFVVHASLDIVEEVMWTNGSMYLKHIDTYPPTSAHISAFLTGTGTKFLILHQPHLPNQPPPPPGDRSSIISLPGLSSSTATTASTSTRSSSSAAASIANNPTSPQTEEAIRMFFTEVFEAWVKTMMSPFFRVGMEIKSPIFRAKVQAAGRKWL